MWRGGDGLADIHLSYWWEALRRPERPSIVRPIHFTHLARYLLTWYEVLKPCDHGSQSMQACLLGDRF